MKDPLSLPLQLPIQRAIKKTTDKKMNTQNRRWCHLLGGSSHDSHNYLQKNEEGVGDGTANSKNNEVQDTVILEDEGDPKTEWWGQGTQK